MTRLLTIYAIGLVGYCFFTHLGFSMGKNRLHLIESIKQQQHEFLLKFAAALPVLPLFLPVAFCMYITTLDTLLWLNRVSLNLPFLADLYGPNMEILKFN